MSSYRTVLGVFLLFFQFRAAPLRAEEALRATVLELEALAGQQRWSEALFRVDEVAVGQRNDRWRKLVSKIVVGHLSQLASEASPGRDGVAIELGRRYPFLGTNEEYRRRRDDAILSAYRDCTELKAKEDDCSARLSENVTDAGDDTGLVVRAVKEVTELQGRKTAGAFLKAKVERVPSSIRERLQNAPELKALLR